MNGRKVCRPRGGHEIFALNKFRSRTESIRRKTYPSIGSRTESPRGGKNQIFRRSPFRSSDHYNHTPVSTIFRGGIRHETDDGFNFVRNIVKTDVDGNNYRAQTFLRTVIVIDGDAKTRPGKLCASNKSNQRRRALK